ncbi:MAG: ATP-binding protein [Bacteroidales bacterium]|jgi:MinD superfamily P-loop ATPase|nr:ATP-binding protein [Bacteroidales bacterium]
MEIAVISGKGGTGKSSISAAFATAAENIVLADCDVDAANLFLLFDPSHEEEAVYIAGHKAVIDYDKCTNCSLCADYCRFDAIGTVNDRVEIVEVSCDGCFLCSRICPVQAISMVPNDRSRMYAGSFRKGEMVYGRLAPGEENSGKLVNMVREKARDTAEEKGINTILLDGPPGTGCPVISTITGVDKAVIVTEPTISGLSDLKRAIEVVTKFGLEALVIINKADINQSMSETITEWCSGENIKIAGTLPYEPLVLNAMISKMSIIEFDENLPISKKIKEIWNNLLNN